MKLINYLKSILYFFIPFISLLLIISLTYYFDFLSNQVIKYFRIIILIVSCLVSGFYTGKNSNNKGYLNGLKVSGLIVFSFLIICLFTKSFRLITLVYYLIIVITITIGSMIGINKKNT